MLALSSEDETSSAFFIGSTHGMSTLYTASPRADSVAVAKPATSPHVDSVAHTKPADSLSAVDSDLELRLLQAFASYTVNQLAATYSAVKNVSGITRFLGNTTERLVTATGLTALVRFLFAQYQRIGSPLLDYVDEAMGKRVIDAVVSVLLLATDHEKAIEHAALEAGQTTTLTTEERLHVLLQGHLPRLEQLVDAAYERGQADAAALTPEPVVMELKDFVPMDELDRAKDAHHEQVRDLKRELAAVRGSMNQLNREKQRLEQELIDVHNYQESEHGQRFQEMEVCLSDEKQLDAECAHAGCAGVGGARADEARGQPEDARPPATRARGRGAAQEAQGQEQSLRTVDYGESLAFARTAAATNADTCEDASQTRRMRRREQTTQDKDRGERLNHFHVLNACHLEMQERSLHFHQPESPMCRTSRLLAA